MAIKERIEPQLRPVELKSLRPTQMTVGHREVARKRHDWRQVRRKGSKFLGRHMLPVVSGPGGDLWLIDQHHLACALAEEGIQDVLVSIIAKADHLDKKTFLAFMDNRGWLHVYDKHGNKRSWKHLPADLDGLEDDPYRSLAGDVRRLGGYAKTETPYSEFLWADFFRTQIKSGQLRRDYEACVERAVELAHSHEAAYLPGYCGSQATGWCLSRSGTVPPPASS